MILSKRYLWRVLGLAKANETAKPHDILAALQTAFASVCGDGTLANRERVATMRALEAMIDQTGCEHFDPAVKDGSLASLISIIVNS
jgi:hypothetical protein